MGIKTKGGGVPVGTEVAFHGGDVPPGWLLEYGQIVLVADYPRLLPILGNRYGGDGVVTMGIPDSRGRTTIGKDGMGGTKANRITAAVSGFDGDTLGAVGGGESVTLTNAEAPIHTHDASQRSSAASGGAPNIAIGATPIGPGGVSLNGSGSGGAHRNMQPCIVANKIIKY